MLNNKTNNSEDFILYVGYPNSLEYKNRKSSPCSFKSRWSCWAEWDNWKVAQPKIVNNLINEHGARFIAFEFIYPTCYRDKLDDCFENFLDYIHNPKTDTEDCFDPSRIFFHKIVRNRFVFGKKGGLFELEDDWYSLHTIPLIEFLYITVDPEFTRKVNPNAIKFKGFFAIRSLVGRENDRLILKVLQSLKLCQTDGMAWELSTAAAANKYWTSLMLPVAPDSEEGFVHTAAFHAFHWFRNYNKSADDYDPIYEDLLGHVEAAYETSLGDLIPFAYMSHKPAWNPTQVNPYVYPEDMKNDEIPGIYVQNSYDTPALLLHLLKVYILLNKIRLVNGIWYEPINDRFLCPLGSNDWFEQNIYGIFAYLRFKTRGALMGLDISHLVSAQLTNAMKLINLDPKFVLNPL